MNDHKAAKRWIELNDGIPFLKPGWANLAACYLEQAAQLEAAKHDIARHVGIASREASARVEAESQMKQIAEQYWPAYTSFIGTRLDREKEIAAEAIQRALVAESRLAAVFDLVKRSADAVEASLVLWEGDARLWPTADKVLKPLLAELRSIKPEPLAESVRVVSKQQADGSFRYVTEPIEPAEGPASGEESAAAPCKTCNGTGLVSGDNCPDCNAVSAADITDKQKAIETNFLQPPACLREKAIHTHPLLDTDEGGCEACASENSRARPAAVPIAHSKSQ